MENDSWENGNMFSNQGAPMILDEPLTTGSISPPKGKKKVLVSLNEKINLDRKDLPIKQIEELDIKPQIIKLDRFDNWVRVDGQLEIEVFYTPKDPGLLEEELDINRFLESMDLENDSLSEESIEWERFFVNEDLDDDDEILDEFDEEEDFDDEPEEFEEIDNNRHVETSTCSINNDKSFSIILDLGERPIDDQDLVALTRIEFSKANLKDAKEINTEIILSVEVSSDKRENSYEEEKWKEVTLYTQGEYPIARSGINLGEILTYYVEPEIDNCKIEDEQLILEGHLNMQVAFYPESQSPIHNISLLSLRNPIQIRHEIYTNELKIQDYQIFLDSIRLFKGDDGNLGYETDVSFWYIEEEDKQFEVEIAEDITEDIINLQTDESEIGDNDQIDLNELLENDQTNFEDILENDTREDEYFDINFELDNVDTEITENTNIITEVDKHDEIIELSDIENDIIKELNLEIENDSMEINDLLTDSNEEKVILEINEIPLFNADFEELEPTNEIILDEKSEYNTDSNFTYDSSKQKARKPVSKIMKNMNNFDAHGSSLQESNYRISLYIIKKGDSLVSIAEKYSLQPEEILSYNKISVNDIKPGNGIFINKHRV